MDNIPVRNCSAMSANFLLNTEIDRGLNSLNCKFD